MKETSRKCMHELFLIAVLKTDPVVEAGIVNQAVDHAEFLQCRRYSSPALICYAKIATNAQRTFVYLFKFALHSLASIGIAVHYYRDGALVRSPHRNGFANSFGSACY